MIVVHDEEMRVLHVLYVHPLGHEETLSNQNWLMTAQSAPVEHIELSRDGTTGARQIVHRAQKRALEIVAQSAG